MESAFYSLFDSFGTFDSSTNIFKNWNSTSISSPDNFTILEPTNLKTSLINIVDEANQSGKKVRAMGHALNFNGITHSQDHIVSFEKCNQTVSKTEMDELISGTNIKKTKIVVQPGKMGRDFANEIDALGYGLPNMANFMHQTIGGVVNSGSHGTLGKDERGGYLSMITEIHMIDGRGENIILNKEDDTMQYAVGLGCVGLIHEIHMVLDIPCYSLNQFTSWFPKDGFGVVCIEEDIAENQFIMYKTTPTHDSIERFAFNKVDTTRDDYGSILIKNVVDYQLLPRIAPRVLETINSFGVGANTINPLVNDIFKKTREGGTYISKSHHILPDASAIPDHIQSEWAICIEDVEDVLADIKEVSRLLPKAKLSEIHIRVSAKSSVILNPAYNRRVVWIDFNTLGIDETSYEAHKLYVNILKKYNGRPHWAKQHYENSEYIESVYPHDAMQKFKTFREEHDPNSIFTSPYTQAVFGLVENDETFMNSLYGLTQVKALRSTTTKKCIIMVPGFSIAYQDIFEPIGTRLFQDTGASVLTYNHFGRGESTLNTSHPYDRKMFICILDKIIETYCGTYDDITILGVSMGGAIVADYMVYSNRDSRINNLVLCAPYAMCGIPVKDKLSANIVSGMGSVGNFVYGKTVFNGIVDSYKAETVVYSDENIQHITEYLGKHGHMPYFNTIRDYLSADHFHDTWVSLDELPVKTHIICGTDDTVVPYDATYCIVKGTVHLIDGVKHNAIKDNGEICEIIEKILR